MERVALISGGSRGLGAALAQDFLTSGDAVATFSRTRTPFIEEQLAKSVIPSEVEGSPDSGDASTPLGMTRFFWRELDVTCFQALSDFARDVARRFGRIDVLINNAALLHEEVLALTRPDDIHRLIAANLEASIHLARAAARVMLRQESGSIINISSINAVRGAGGVSVYSATKAGLDGFTRSLARELGPRNIRVNSVAPGFFDSDMSASFTDRDRDRIIRRTPLGRLGTTDDIVAAIRFLVSDDARFITGQTLVVDGGWSC